MHEGHEIGQVSDVFLSGKAIVDIASLFTVIMIRGVFLYTASTLDRLWQKKNPETKHSINLKRGWGRGEGREGKKKNEEHLWQRLKHSYQEGRN